MSDEVLHACTGPGDKQAHLLVVSTQTGLPGRLSARLMPALNGLATLTELAAAALTPLTSSSASALLSKHSAV